MHELFFNLIHNKVEEEVNKDNKKDIRKISVDNEGEEKNNKKKSNVKRKSVVDININDLDIGQIQSIFFKKSEMLQINVFFRR